MTPFFSQRCAFLLARKRQCHGTTQRMTFWQYSHRATVAPVAEQCFSVGRNAVTSLSVAYLTLSSSPSSSQSQPIRGTVAMWNRSVPKISGLPEMSTKNCTYGTSTFPQQLGEIARRQSLSSLTSTSSWWRIATDEGWCIAATVALFVAFAMSLSALEQMTLCDAAAASSTPQDGSVTTASSSSSSSSSTVAALTPAAVATLDFDQMVEKNSATEESLPMYRADELALHDGTDASRRIWMSYGGIIYDVTDFIQNHPGGVEKIIQAAGSSIEPYWYLYRQHYASDLPIKLLERMAVGRLHPDDQDAIDAQMAVLEEEDPYAREPVRNDKLKVHSDTPMNAEVPARLLTESYLTPNDLFYIRHHHPVPLLTASQLQDYRLVVDLTALGGGGKHEYTVEELKALLPRTEVTVTLQCSGNRRGGFNAFQRTSGTPWGQGAVSTATFAGVRLRDLLDLAGLKDPIEAQDKQGMEHVRFHALDGMMASIGIEKAVNPYGDCIVAYEMNGEALPRDHGFPLRIIVPGYAAVRNVKWVERIEVAATEAEGPWQRGLNYKTLPPSVTDANTVDLSEMPSMTEVSLFSGITKIDRISMTKSSDNEKAQVMSTTNSSRPNPGDRIMVRVGGWAWAGGGRNIVRVDVTGDNGTSWATATLTDGSQQRFGRSWAWVFWECELPVVVQEDGTVHVASKAVDLAFNVQPENSQHTWNARGLGNNSWYRAHAQVMD